MYLTLTLAMPAGLPSAARLRHRRSDDAGQRGLVVGPGVDVGRDVTGDRDLGHSVAGAVEQLPHALVAVQRGQLAEPRAGERERMAAAVGVAADGERRVSRPASSARTEAGETPGWSPSRRTSTSPSMLGS